jgi:sulfate/thiosulfate transport system substrate-binding protein
MCRLALAGVAAAILAFSNPLEVAHADTTLLNASYEPTRRFYSDLNKAFAARHRSEANIPAIIPNHPERRPLTPNSPA